MSTDPDDSQHRQVNDQGHAGLKKAGNPINPSLQLSLVSIRPVKLTLLYRLIIKSSDHSEPG